jgi:hypothetical protein
MPLAEVALRHLENTFGRIEEVFVADWAPLAGALTQKDGYANFVAYDQESDSITAKTAKGLALTIQGSNLVEAAVWLPRFEMQVYRNLPNIPEGVQSVSIRFKGDQWCRAASPLEMHTKAKDYRQLDPFVSAVFDQAAADNFLIALSNRVA